MNLERLLKENVAEALPVDYKPSPRLTNEDGEPQVWVIRPLTSKEINRITERHTSSFRNPKTGQKVQNVDFESLGKDVVLEALVAPSKGDLEQGIVLDSWGVTNPYAVLEAMLLPGELSDLSQKVQELAGYEAMNFNVLAEDIEKK